MIENRNAMTKAAIMILGFAAATWLLEKMSPVLIPFVFAVFLYYNVLPVIQFIQKRFQKITHGPAVALALLFYAIVYALIGWLIAASVKQGIDSAGLYEERVLAFNVQLSEKLSTFGIELGGEQVKSAVKNSQLFSWLTNLSGSIAGILGNLGLVLVILLFILVSPIPHERPMMIAVQKQMVRYVVLKTITSLFTGVAVGVSLALFHVDMASLFGVLTFLLNYVPNVGALISIILPLPVALLQFGFGPQFVASLAVPAVIQFLIGSLIEPRLLGDTLDIHPLAVLMALMYWGLVWGIVGMFLAVPLLVVMKIVLQRFERTKVVADWLAGRF